MTTQAADTLVRAATEVHAPIERAFEVFTQDIGSWWDTNHHILQGELAEMVFEPRAGGQHYGTPRQTPSPVSRSRSFDPPPRWHRRAG